MNTTTALYFDYLRRMVQQHCGVLLEGDKEYLMASALEPSLERWGMESMADLMERLWKDAKGKLARQVVEALIPTETYFFREPTFFEALEKKVIPDLVEKRKAEKRLLIWSAACSTGQEPYSLLMLIKEKFPFLFQWDLQLTATDFSKSSLARAQEGRYNKVEVNRGLPSGYLSKYFHPLGSDWQVNDDLRAFLQFKETNLMDPRAEAGPVDLLLLRNVLIYFDTEMKKKVLLTLHKALRPDGYLFLGSSETTLFLDKGLESLTMDGPVTGYKLRR